MFGLALVAGNRHGSFLIALRPTEYARTATAKLTNTATVCAWRGVNCVFISRAGGLAKKKPVVAARMAPALSLVHRTFGLEALGTRWLYRAPVGCARPAQRAGALLLVARNVKQAADV